MTHQGAARKQAKKPVSIRDGTLMRANLGFTLVELMVVVGIIGIVLAIATMNIRQWNDKYTVESYTKEIHSILMKARNDAANTNTPVSITLAANLITTFRDFNGNAIADPGETITKPHPQFSMISDLGLPTTIIFDRRGIPDNTPILSITNYAPNASPGVDCVVVAPTRINMGIMTGGACVLQ